MPKRTAKQYTTGGSAASDAVEALVDPSVWPILNDRFSNEFAATGGGGARRRRGGSSCARHSGAMSGGACGCRGGGSVPASVPIGSTGFKPLNTHSDDARFNAASKNVNTFPLMNANRYGVPVSALAPASGGAKAKPKSKTAKSAKSAKPKPKSAKTAPKAKSAKPKTKPKTAPKTKAKSAPRARAGVSRK